NALKDYERAVRLDPAHDEARQRLAEILLHTSRPAEAVSHYQLLHQRQPGNPTFVAGLARCKRSLGEAEEARQLLDDLLAQHPQDLGALIERGILALEEKQAPQALGWLQQAVVLAPYDRLARYTYFRCLQELGRKEEADACRAELGRIEDDL